VHLVVVHALMDLEAEAVVPTLSLTAEDNRQVLRAHEGVLVAIRARNPGEARKSMGATRPGRTAAAQESRDRMPDSRRS